jgi:FkbH-like protein
LSETPSRCLLLSDFNVGSFANYLENDEELPAITAATGPYGQFAPPLLDDAGELWNPAPECVVVWTRPQAAVPAFAEVLNFSPVAPEELLAQVDAFAALVARAAERSRLVLVPSWVAPSAERGWGLTDLRPRQGIAAALARMNLRLAEQLQQPNVFVVDGERWLRQGGHGDAAAKLWFMGKVPFANEVLQEAARDVRAALAALHGQARKLVVVDLDDTLWGGIVGDVGWENLRVGGHDHAGEAYLEFQKALKALTRRGVILGIVSKNTEEVALEAMRKHPEMHLRVEDFAGYKINWRDKAQNLAELARELRLGLQSVVFLDDNPVERARVREALPEVLVPEWPATPMLYARALRALRCFDVLSATDEDARRAAMYQAERRRQAEMQEMREVGNAATFLAGLGTTVTVEPLGDANLARTAQLLNKTNQMNLRTRRLTERELKEWAAQPGHRLWSFRVADRLGDSGLTGIASVAADGDTFQVVDYVLSCRVMGRKVEETMLAFAVAQARQLGASRVTAQLLPTAKNQPCLEFFRRSGFEEQEDHRFSWDAGREYPVPDVVRVVVEGG